MLCGEEGKMGRDAVLSWKSSGSGQLEMSLDPAHVSSKRVESEGAAEGGEGAAWARGRL